MGHRKWTSSDTWPGWSQGQAEHNALYDAYKNSEKWRMDCLDENNRLDRELDEARKRIAELESPLRVPFSDVQIERMAIAASDAYSQYWIAQDFPKLDYPRSLLFRKWEEHGEKMKESRILMIRAALAAGGLEPCAVPEYDPADVALASSDDEVEKLARVLRETHAKTCGKVPDAYELDGFRNDARAAIAHLRQPTGHVLRDRLVDAERKVENQRAELKRLNALVAELRDEVNEDNTNAAAVNDLLVQVQNLTAERDALRERDSVPVKVRWDVSDDHIKMTVELGTFIRLDLDKVAHLREVFAAHAVIDVPAGVPSMEELEQLVISTYCSHDGKRPSVWHRIATAIRDRILAGLAQPSSKSGQFDADEVEALARVLHEAEPSMPPATYRERNEALARAAIAHLRKRPEGLPTALMLAQSAFAAIRPTDSDWPYQPKPETDRWVAIADHILAALAPYLRDPVGWELDVDPEEMYTAWCKCALDYGPNRMIAVLDLCRSRIRPTYECKKCARRKELGQISDEDLLACMKAARAALEDE